MFLAPHKSNLTYKIKSVDLQHKRTYKTKTFGNKNWLLNQMDLPTNRYLSTPRSLSVPCFDWGSWCCVREFWRKDLQDRWSWQLLGSYHSIPWLGPYHSIPWLGLTSLKQQGSWLAKPNFLPSSTLLCSPRRGQWIRDEMLRQGIQFYQKDRRQDDGRWMSQNNHLIRGWMVGSFLEQREGEVRRKNKKGSYSYKSLLE